MSTSSRATVHCRFSFSFFPPRPLVVDFFRTLKSEFAAYAVVWMIDNLLDIFVAIRNGSCILRIEIGCRCPASRGNLTDLLRILVLVRIFQGWILIVRANSEEWVVIGIFFLVMILVWESFAAVSHLDGR